MLTVDDFVYLIYYINILDTITLHTEVYVHIRVFIII